jgi:hypothetical protein
MENQARHMNSEKSVEKDTKRIPKNKERLTIMIFKRVGKVKTFKISSSFLLWVSLFFAFYIVTTIFFTNLFIDYYHRNRILTDENAELRAMLMKTKRSLDESKQHIALLNDYIAEKKDQSSESPATIDHAESSLPKLVDIDELKIERNESTVHIDFKIMNKQSNDEPIGGYIFIFARIKDSEKSEVWVYPNSQLEEGLPVNYRNGLRFFIQKFKLISSTYKIKNAVNSPLILEILVYDRDGEIILKKSVEA